jgi:hypothetical protein
MGIGWLAICAAERRRDNVIAQGSLSPSQPKSARIGPIQPAWPLEAVASMAVYSVKKRVAMICRS